MVKNSYSITRSKYIPGKANKWLAPLATKIGITFPATASFFKGKAVEVGLPLREGYQLEKTNKDVALRYYGLSAQYPILLIFGGSQGSQAINQLVANCLPILKKLSIQVIHFTGNVDRVKALADLYNLHQVPACVKAFEDRMEMAWRIQMHSLGAQEPPLSQSHWNSKFLEF